MLNWPPSSAAPSKRSTAWPRSASRVAQARPAGPAPTTAIFRGVAAGFQPRRVSWQARGFTRQLHVFRWNTKSRQAWLQAMQVLISSARPERAFATNAGSARSGRAIETMSASPSARTRSATSGVLIRFVVQSGMPTWPFSFRVTQVKAARGTEVAMVGTRASCQPMPVLRMVTPAASSARATCTTSSQLLPSGTRSSMERRKITMKSRPTASRSRETISTGRRIRFA